jgi:isopentenyl-diphosphate Delta-isomerase
MTDMIDVLDDSGLRTGEIMSRRDIHAQGKPHRAVHLYLFDMAGRLLLQQRAADADHYPGFYGISVTGHLDAGESSQQAARRELQEELSLDPACVRMDFLFSYRKDAALRPDYIDRQFNDVYACHADFTLTDIVTENRAQGLKLVSFGDFQAMVAGREDELAPVYGQSCQDVMYFLQNFLGRK